ncbi:hypothetical protein B7P43_G03593, partial [Cryptotermes secundus]
SRTSVVNIATSYGLDDRCVGVRVPVGSRMLYQGIKRQGREADHSPSSSAEVKKMWIYTSAPTYVFMA